MPDTPRRTIHAYMGLHIYTRITHIGVKSSCFSFYRDLAFSQLAGEMAYMKTWVQIPAFIGCIDWVPGTWWPAHLASVMMVRFKLSDKLKKGMGVGVGRIPEHTCPQPLAFTRILMDMYSGFIQSRNTLLHTHTPYTYVHTHAFSWGPISSPQDAQLSITSAAALRQAEHACVLSQHPLSLSRTSSV